MGSDRGGTCDAWLASLASLTLLGESYSSQVPADLRT